MAEEPKQTEETTQKTDNASTNTLRLQDVFMMGLKKWPWILLSVFVCLGIATIYLVRTAPTYTRSAAIRIKNDQQGNSISSDMDGFANLGLFQSNANVIDEISALESSNFMKEVVKRLNLTYSFYKDGSFHKDVAYGKNLPITIVEDTLTDNFSGSFVLKVAPDKTVTMSDVVRNGEEFPGKTFKGRLGGMMNSPFGRLDILPSPSYKAGEDIKLSVVKHTIKQAVDSYKSRLKVSLKNEKGNVISMVYTDGSIERAEDVLNALIAVYNENWINEKNQVAVSTSNFINERLNVIEQELGNVDQDISSYKSEHLIPDVDQASALYMQQSQTTSDKLVSLGTQLQMARYVKDFMTDRSSSDQALPTNVGLTNANIESQIDNYNRLLLQRNALQANSSSRNPLVKDYDIQLSALRSGVLSSIDNLIISLRKEIGDLEMSERQTTSRIAANPTQARYLLSVERQQKVKESLYLFLLQKREENELSQAFTAYNTSVIDNPDGTPTPTSPVKRNVYLIALLVGFLFPFGVIYVTESNNTKLRGRKDLENLSVPFIGEIPIEKHDKKDKAENRIVVSEGNRDIINEAFRVLRTNLDFMSSGEKGAKVILVTSFNPSSGKTFITMNLAMSLALKGEKVLVIDGDLRRASASAYINSPKKGISNWLIGSDNDLDSLIVCDTLHKDLCVLPVGALPPNPTELLENGKFPVLIEELKKHYDYIFIDCPPAGMMADAHIMEKESDRTLFVVRAGLLERIMIPELDKLYKEKKFKNMGIVLNGTTGNDNRYGYGYRYYTKYGHYGYSDNKKKKKKLFFF